jgi:hypothetical protein
MSEIVKITIKYESQTDLSERWTDAKDFTQEVKTVYGVEAAVPDATYTSTKITVRIFSALADFSSAYSCSAERYCGESKSMAPAAPRSPSLRESR